MREEVERRNVVKEEDMKGRRWKLRVRNDEEREDKR